MNSNKLLFIKNNSPVEGPILQTISPQLACNINRKKYYLYLINQNKKLIEKKYTPYTPLYFNTGYDKMYYPDKSTPFT